MPITYTPLRYPGGKSSLYPVISRLIKENSLQVSTYVEPFAGGAGLAIKLLLLGEVDSIVLNDLDPAIAAFWNAVTKQSDSLTAFIQSVDISLDEWATQHDMYKKLREKALSEYQAAGTGQNRASSPLDYLTQEEQFALACSAFYLNRTNRSGIMAGGPIGGKKQEGSYKIDARFNRTNLVSKINAIADRSDSVSVHNLDAADFIKTVVPGISKGEGSDVLAYFDPPYVAKGPGLYQNSLTEDDHRRLSKLIRQCPVNWIVTYDECALIRSLYGDMTPSELSIGYCAYEIKKGKEIMVLSKGLALSA